MRLPNRILGSLSAVLLALFLALPAQAESSKFAAELSSADRGAINHIENYLNGLKTVEARFVQISSTGDFAEGNLYIARPGRLRIEYDEPNPNLIVADGLWLIHYDKELSQATHVLLDSTPAAILVDEKVALDSDDLVITAFENAAGVLRLSVVRAEDPGEGTVTLVFNEKPLRLKKWTVVDPQGVVTTVSLQNPRFGGELDSNLFHLDVDTPKSVLE